MIEAWGLDPDGKPPELHEDLVPYLDDENGLTTIRHPWIYSIGHIEFKNSWANKFYEYKKRAVAQAYEEQDWSQFIWLHERPYRLDTFFDIQDMITDEQYWKLLSEIWTDTENMWQNSELWEDCLRSDRPQREHFMDEDEQKTLASMKDEFLIYRGTSEGLSIGLSWTLDRKRATWFAKRFKREGKALVITGKIKRDNVIAFLDGRGEQEIVAFKEDVTNLRRTSAS